MQHGLAGGQWRSKRVKARTAWVVAALDDGGMPVCGNGVEDLERRRHNPRRPPPPCGKGKAGWTEEGEVFKAAPRGKKNKFLDEARWQQRERAGQAFGGGIDRA